MRRGQMLIIIQEKYKTSDQTNHFSIDPQLIHDQPYLNKKRNKTLKHINIY